MTRLEPLPPPSPARRRGARCRCRRMVVWWCGDGGGGGPIHSCKHLELAWQNNNKKKNKPFINKIKHT